MLSKSELAYSALREAILSAGVLPGEHLAEVAWSDRLEVGRFAIREALKRLHGEGLVSRNRSKYLVTVPNAEEIHEIGHLRSVLEAGSLRLLAGRPSRDILKAIRKAARDHAALVKKEYFAGAREADLRFHRALVAASQNPRLIRMYESANLPLLQVTIGRHPSPLDDFELAAQEHHGICLALEEGDTQRAAKLLEAHLRRGEREVLGKP